MPNFELFPLQGTVLSATTITTNTTTANFTLPYAQSYRFVVDVQTVSGTNPTLQTIICTSTDGGTTYEEILSFSQITTSGLGRQMTFRPYLGYGDVGTEATSAVVGFSATIDIASGILANNGPIDPAHMKLRFVVGGTGSPTFTATRVAWLATAPGVAD